MIKGTYAALAAAASFSAVCYGGQFTTIDCPNATSTQAVSLNNHNRVVGTCIINQGTRSFLHMPNGVMHVFTVQQSPTFAADINDSGVITGYYAKSKNASHGFLFTSGVATDFDYPGASSTTPIAINAGGSVTGIYQDSLGVHGFIRDSAGNFSTFDPVGSSYTVPRSINASGEVAGFFYTGSAATQGFVRDALGNISTFTAPNSYATTAFQINDGGSITGWFTPASSFYAQGFVRDPTGSMTTFAAPNIGTNGNTFSMSINTSGEVTGYAIQGMSPYYYFGFTKSPSSAPVNFSDPNAVNYTVSQKINDAGVVAGWYADITTDHAFIAKP